MREGGITGRDHGQSLLLDSWIWDLDLSTLHLTMFVSTGRNLIDYRLRRIRDSSLLFTISQRFHSSPPSSLPPSSSLLISWPSFFVQSPWAPFYCPLPLVLSSLSLDLNLSCLCPFIFFVPYRPFDRPTLTVSCVCLLTLLICLLLSPPRNPSVCLFLSVCLPCLFACLSACCFFPFLT